MIRLPRPLLVALATGFSAYVMVVGAASVPGSMHPWRVVVALLLFAVLFVLSVLLGRTVTMPAWLGGLNAGAVLTIALLCTSTLDPAADVDNGTWYVGAAGCLLVVTMVRRRPEAAWLGVGFLVGQTLFWAGPEGEGHFGVLAAVLWVTVAHFGTRSLMRAMKDVSQFARAEREAVEWQAAQDAHHFERQVRLTQTSRVALPMLRRIVAVDGALTDEDRQECRVLEQTIRDEIRGRRLLNDAVRAQVIAHRRRGAIVQVLDDGGLDDIEPSWMDPVLDKIAYAIARVHSDRIIIRTAPKGSERAVTVVGISTDPTAAALGLDDESEEVDLWLELDRPAGAPALRP